jgi:hypothetical protein
MGVQVPMVVVVTSTAPRSGKAAAPVARSTPDRSRLANAAGGGASPYSIPRMARRSTHEEILGTGAGGSSVLFIMAAESAGMLWSWT